MDHVEYFQSNVAIYYDNQNNTHYILAFLNMRLNTTLATLYNTTHNLQHLQVQVIA